jgi:hypothetical protein
MRCLTIFLLGLLVSTAAFASTTVYVDFNCKIVAGQSCNAGTQASPYNSWSQIWTAVNSAITAGGSSLPVTVYIAARQIGSSSATVISSQLDLSQCTAGTNGINNPSPTGCFSPSNPQGNVLFDGISKYNSGTNLSPVWSTNVTPVACTDFAPETSKTCVYNTAAKLTIQAEIPATGPNGPSDFENCVFGFTVQGFSFQANGSSPGQAADMAYVGNLLFQYDEVEHISSGGNGPNLYIGPAQHGPCHTGASRPSGTDSGPDGVTVQYNYDHDSFGELLYAGASTPDPFDNSSTCTTCQQYEGGSSSGQLDLTCGNGCSSQSQRCSSTSGTIQAATCNTGSNYQVIGNTFESGAVYSSSSSTPSKGDCVDFKDGHFNVTVKNNVCKPGLYSSACLTGYCFCYNGTNPGTSCTTNSACTGGGTCQAGGDQSRGIVYEGDDGVIDSNYIDTPFRDGVYLNSAWNNRGGGNVRVSNNIINNVNSGVGHNYGIEAGVPAGGSGIGLATIATAGLLNNTIYNAGNSSIDTGGGITTASGSATSSITVTNNIVSTSYFGIDLGQGTNSYADCYNNTTGTCPGSNNQTGNPDFTSTTFPVSAASNFELQSGSLAIGKGTDLSTTFTNDYLGNTRTDPWTIGAFQGPYYDVSVTISGSGTVTTNPPGTACTGACNYSFEVGTLMTFTVTAGQFVDWGGACSKFKAQTICTGKVTGPTSVTADFN